MNLAFTSFLILLLLGQCAAGWCVFVAWKVGGGGERNANAHYFFLIKREEEKLWLLATGFYFSLMNFTQIQSWQTFFKCIKIKLLSEWLTTFKSYHIIFRSCASFLLDTWLQLIPSFGDCTQHIKDRQHKESKRVGKGTLVSIIIFYFSSF